VRRIAVQDLLHARHFGGGLRGFGALMTDHQHREIAAHFRRGSHHVRYAGLQLLSIVIRYD
jgi:hypothetical protein